MNDKYLDIVSRILKSHEILEVIKIQDLWSGYGQLLRVALKDQSVIIKIIKLPVIKGHPKGWNSEFSHHRKIKSYQVELNWYKNYTQQHGEFYTPQIIDSGEIDGSQYLVLEDLKESGFQSKTKIEWNEVKSCIQWLARFHQHHLAYENQGLWPEGTYWHLETRPEELSVMKDIQLKDNAKIIANKLKNAKYQTIIHGDAKLANFLFNSSSVAAIDFQYVGRGVGVKDLAYFLSSIYNEKELFENEQECLDLYFNEFTNLELIKEWRDLYPYAWCDFYRFLNGWSPEHYKINQYSQKMRDQVLNEINS